MCATMNVVGFHWGVEVRLRNQSTTSIVETSSYRLLCSLPHRGSMNGRNFLSNKLSVIINGMLFNISMKTPIALPYQRESPNTECVSTKPMGLPNLFILCIHINNRSLVPGEF